MKTRLKDPVWAIFLLVLTGCGCFAGALESRAGVLVQGGPVWRFYSMVPQADEDTPNFQGYGLDLVAGYSIGRILDIGLLGQYTPGNLGAAKLMEEDSSLALLGGIVALRFSKLIYAGLYGGTGYYNGINHAAAEKGLLKGNWQGPAGGLTIGATIGQPRSGGTVTTQVQLFAERMWTEGKQTAEAEREKRSFSAFGLGLTWVYNGLGGSSWENQIIGGFLD